MANTYKNIVITPNTGSTTGDPTIVFSGGDSNTNTDIILRVYPTSNGTLSFEGNAGQLFSITNDLSNTIFSVNDVSGIPLLEINVASQQITLGQFYGNVGIGTNASNVNNYKLDVIGGANISLPNLTVGGTNVSAAIAAANANAATLSANVNVLAAAVVANDASQGANIATLAASFVSNSQSLSANVNTLAATFASANANNVSLSANVNVLAAALSGYATTGQLANYLPLAGGTLTGRVIQSASGFGVGTDDTINTRIDSGFWQTSNAQISTGWPESTATWYHLITSTHSNDANYFSMQFAGSFFDSNALYYRATMNSGTTAWNKLWHAGNDGAGSGLDADTVDGIQASSFYLASNPSGYLTTTDFNTANANSISQSANVNVLAAAFVSNTQTLSANVNVLAGTFAAANANNISLSANVNVLAAAFVSNTQTLSANVNVLAAATAARLPLAGGTMTGLIIGRTTTGANTSVANDGGALSARGDATNAAVISFHRPSAYAINMGLDTDNIFRIGGWSDGVNTYRVQLGTPGGTHTFTGTVAATTFSGAGTSLTGTAASLTAGNATTAGGFTPSQTNGVGNRIVVADASGFINNNYFNSTDDISAGTITYIMAKFGDNYYRSATAAKVASFLASQSFASPTFTGTGSVTGGFNVTPGNLGTISSGTTTLSAGSGNYQYYTNGGAHTIAAPGSDCAIDILVTNSATAGAITLSGFTAPSGGGGDTYATTNTQRFLLMVRRINSISTYVWKALQ